MFFFTSNARKNCRSKSTLEENTSSTCVLTKGVKMNDLHMKKKKKTTETELKINIFFL